MNIRLVLLLGMYGTGRLFEPLRQMLDSDKLTIHHIAYLLGKNAEIGLCNLLHKSLHSVAPNVLSNRLFNLTSIDVQNPLNTLRIPVDHLVPTQDRLLKKKEFDKIHALKPEMRTHHIDGPHLLLQSEPAACAGLIKVILKIHRSLEVAEKN